MKFSEYKINNIFLLIKILTLSLIWKNKENGIYDKTLYKCAFNNYKLDNRTFFALISGFKIFNMNIKLFFKMSEFKGNI